MSQVIQLIQPSLKWRGSSTTSFRKNTQKIKILKIRMMK